MPRIPAMPSALEKIAAFVQEHHVLTLATVAAAVPYATPLFYAYDPERNRFVFASAADTKHAKQLQQNPSVAAAIALETEAVGKIQGVQLTGVALSADDADRKCYYARFPYARALQPLLWRIEPDWMKLTDNRLGFGKKLVWEATAPV